MKLSKDINNIKCAKELILLNEKNVQKHKKMTLKIQISIFEATFVHMKDMKKKILLKMNLVPNMQPEMPHVCVGMGLVIYKMPPLSLRFLRPCLKMKVF